MTIFELESKMPGVFHDALLHSYSVDLNAGIARFIMEVCIGDPTALDDEKREARQLGTLTLTGLDYLSSEIPDFEYDRVAPYLVDLCEAEADLLKRRPPALGGFSARFFFSTTNSFISFSALSADFSS